MAYLLFAFQRYYPSGGWDDIEGEYETVEAAKSAFENLADITPETIWTGQSCQIVDKDSLKIVLRFNDDTYIEEKRGWQVPDA